MISTQFFTFFLLCSFHFPFSRVGVEAFRDVKKILLDGASGPRKALYNAPPLKERRSGRSVFTLKSLLSDVPDVLLPAAGDRRHPADFKRQRS
jgi:hypothetical protein